VYVQSDVLLFYLQPCILLTYVQPSTLLIYGKGPIGLFSYILLSSTLPRTSLQPCIPLRTYVQLYTLSLTLLRPCTPIQLWPLHRVGRNNDCLLQSIQEALRLPDISTPEDLPVGVAILPEFQDNKNRIRGEVWLSNLKVKPGFQAQLINILPVEKFPLFVATSYVAEEINPGVSKLGRYSARFILRLDYSA